MLTRAELNRLTAESSDPDDWVDIHRKFDNVDLTDDDLVHMIERSNHQRKPTALLRFEYHRRLSQRGLMGDILSRADLRRFSDQAVDPESWGVFWF